jgi:FKBP-type peptidyl-prolyl cis-trans isomerase FklB
MFTVLNTFNTFLLCLLFLTIFAGNFLNVNTMSFENQVEKFSYAIGLSLASNLIQSGIRSLDYKSLFQSMEDALEGRALKMNAEDANRVITEHFQNQQANIGAINQKAGDEFLAKNKQEEGIVTLESGLQYKILVDGDGPKPKVSNQVKCHYHGTLIDGTVFDSSVKRGQPAVFPVNGVIKGWIEALQLMPTGSKWRLFIPPHLAYGDNGAGGAIGPKATLIFDVELIEIV